ncbi:Extracellular matrix-binding ebh, putative [Babesia ovata]|uniref:Extracellular matrix-binding ebh, putative n=1 Tax=Babesia ovata TaxID=189622 RepID=A0A2H6KJ18_9APIC|nr:Extracellular matrix-binding ebh, putative [Babesia ovata]GBE62971.1 Extracellular matrix-binding ebh, putative [Babesia ovata]
MTSPSRCFVISFFHYSPCPQSPNALLHPSFQWIKEADEAVKVAKQKAENVYEQLDHTDNNGDPKTPIGQGVKQINDAKDKVFQVDEQLQTVHDDLGGWKSAANSVLGLAVEKARDVHRKLDPNQQGGEIIIGTKIGAIKTSNEAIRKANEDLKKHVESLHSWIDTAEQIRQAAETKAKEAYDKLKVNETLDENVKKIVEAKEEIEKVHNNLKSVDNSLGEWKQQAGDVLQGAIGKAKEVHDALEDEKSKDGIGKSIEVINTSSESIKKANITLGAEVGNLQSWRTAAGSVIDKANGKCEEILKKVKTDGDGKIFTEAEKLKTEGTRLLKAATAAKKAVEQNVTAALQAVVKMDESLKKDLKGVKDKIKLGIAEVIKKLEVEKLGDKVKIDLESLRDKIEKLNNGDELVTDNLAALAETKKSTLDEKAEAIKTSESQLEGKFTKFIQQPLNSKVEEVYTAIGTLGGRFGLDEDDKKKLEKIFGNIHSKVAEIKGTAGKSWTNEGGKGLDGINSKVQHYFNAFNAQWPFGQIVTGWIDDILQHNGLVKGCLGGRIRGRTRLRRS